MNMLATIRRCADPGMSDDQLDLEHRAQIALNTAVATMRKAIAQVNKDSTVETINPDAFEDFVHDWLPQERAWDDRIAEARRG
jgi:hypothetical protein